MVAVAMMLSSRFVDYHLIFARDLRLNARYIFELKVNVVRKVLFQNPAHVRLGALAETGLLHNANRDQIVLPVNHLKTIHKLALSIDHEESAPEVRRDHAAVLSSEYLARSPEKILDHLELPSAGAVRWCGPS